MAGKNKKAQNSQKGEQNLFWGGGGLTKAGCIRSLLVASRLQVRRDIREYAAANKASVASTCPWARYNFAYFFLGHGPLFSEQKERSGGQRLLRSFGKRKRGRRRHT